jgi:hypothetical protein
LAGPAAYGEPLVLHRRDLVTGEWARVTLELPPSPAERAELLRGSALQRGLFNKPILVPAPRGGVTVVLQMRDLLAHCRPGGCELVGWRSPRTRALAADPPPAGTPPLSLLRLFDAVAVGDGLAILPMFTAWDPRTGVFAQRDEVTLLGHDGRVTARCPLTVRGTGLLAKGGEAWVLLETGRLARACP